jgi:hypothetical protein
VKAPLEAVPHHRPSSGRLEHVLCLDWSRTTHDPELIHLDVERVICADVHSISAGPKADAAGVD